MTDAPASRDNPFTPDAAQPDPAQPDAAPTGLGRPGTPLSGTLRLRVRYAECDPMGVAHHASYLPWLEIARTELLRAAGRTYRAMEAAGLFLVITKAEVRYRRPIRYDDLLDIRVRADLSSRIKITHAYEVCLAERDGRPFASLDPNADPTLPRDGVCSVATTELACVGRDGRPTPLPDWLQPTLSATPAERGP